MYDPFSIKEFEKKNKLNEIAVKIIAGFLATVLLIVMFAGGGTLAIICIKWLIDVIRG